jgi:hypothetical protein
MQKVESILQDGRGRMREITAILKARLPLALSTMRQSYGYRKDSPSAVNWAIDVLTEAAKAEELSEAEREEARALLRQHEEDSRPIPGLCFARL